MTASSTGSFAGDAGMPIGRKRDPLGSTLGIGGNIRDGIDVPDEPESEEEEPEALHNNQWGDADKDIV